MTNKTYNQYCAIAHALDLVGERWTLLVVRNLLAGPKRFSDLMKGLPGISTNILTDRLKSLEENVLITTRYLPPPAASTVYELTESGRALAGALGALAQWGAQTLGAPQAGQFIPTESIVFMLLGVFWREGRPPMPLTCNVTVTDAHDNQSFGIVLSGSGIEIAENALPSADSGLSIALEPLLRLSSQQATLHALIDSGEAQIQGETGQIERLLAWVDGEVTP